MLTLIKKARFLIGLKTKKEDNIIFSTALSSKSQG